MTRCEPMEISKEVYERALKCGKYIDSSDKLDVFGPSLVYGYGVYADQVYIDKDTGKYMVGYMCGSSCD